MTRLSPLYTVDNTSVAWQLHWTLTLFWREPTFGSPWLDDLKASLESDGIRILGHQRSESGPSQLLLSTRPDVKPVDVAGKTKGRLQYVLRDETPAVFRRNYDLHSVGSTQREKVEAYVASQLEHHEIQAPELKWPLTDLQFIDRDIPGAPKIYLACPVSLQSARVFEVRRIHNNERTRMGENTDHHSANRSGEAPSFIENRHGPRSRALCLRLLNQ